MVIIDYRRFNSEDIYFDYPFETVMFRCDYKTTNIYRKFYGEKEFLEPIPSSNRLYYDARQFGEEITSEQYQKGKEKP